MAYSYCEDRSPPVDQEPEEEPPPPAETARDTNAVANAIAKAGSLLLNPETTYGDLKQKDIEDAYENIVDAFPEEVSGLAAADMWLHHIPGAPQAVAVGV